MSLLKALNLLPNNRMSGAANSATLPLKTGSAQVKAEKLTKAAEAWRETHGQANERIAELKRAILNHYSDAHPELVKEIDAGLKKLDDVMSNVDHRLADAMHEAGTEQGDAARSKAIEQAKSVFSEYIKYVKGEPLVAHMDGNPFGVKTDLKTLLISGLTSAAKAM